MTDAPPPAPRGFADTPHHAEDLHAWQVLRPLLDAGGYLPWSAWAIRPAALVVVCNLVVLEGRRRIVECGSGVSTVVLARLLQARRAGGSITALEHDEGWAALVAEQLEREGLDGIAHVVHAPLEGEPAWYRRSVLDAVPDDVELLLVDGPPAFEDGAGLRRLPALDALGGRLAPDARIVLDDAHRPGEQEVVRRWEDGSAWRFAIDDRAGVAVGHRALEGAAAG